MQKRQAMRLSVSWKDLVQCAIFVVCVCRTSSFLGDFGSEIHPMEGVCVLVCGLRGVVVFIVYMMMVRARWWWFKIWWCSGGKQGDHIEGTIQQQQQAAVPKYRSQEPGGVVGVLLLLVLRRRVEQAPRSASTRRPLRRSPMLNIQKKNSGASRSRCQGYY